MAKTPEEKLADNIISSLDNHWFNPAIVANILSNQQLYTIDRLFELVAQISKYQDIRYKTEWVNGNTSEGLLMFSLVADTIDSKQNPDDHIQDIEIYNP